MIQSCAPRIRVAAAAIEDSAGRLLIAQRPSGKPMAGAWEFPGGKVESGELLLGALARELREELGIEIGRGPHRPVGRISHSYNEFDVLINVWRIRDYSGTPSGLDGQVLRWVTIDELPNVGMLAADEPVISALCLPEVLIEPFSRVYAVGRREPAKSFGVMCDSVAAAFEAERSGADFAIMRLKLPDRSLSDLCSTLLIPVFATGISLGVAWRLGASGINSIETQA